jgi:hypothetical protein
MAKTPMKCPFNDKLCIECHLYRGRHYYLCNCKQYRGYIQPKDAVNRSVEKETADFDKLQKLLEPWSVSAANKEKHAAEKKINLKIIDMETGQQSTCEPDVAKNWNWDDPTIMRLVHGVHVSTWAKLAELLRYHQEKGADELVIYEGPRFMMLAGG